MNNFLEERMTPKQAGEFLGLKKSTLANMRSQGNGPAYLKPYGRIFYIKKDLEAFLKKCFRNKRAYVGIAVNEWYEGEGLLQCPDTGNECYSHVVGVSAAREILGNAFKAIEIESVEERLLELEKHLLPN